MKLSIASLYSFLLVPVALMAVEPNEEAVLPASRDWIKEITATWQKTVTADQQVKHGIRADRKARRVEIAAVGTGLAESGVIEFVLVAENGRAYESLSVTTAKPSEVVQALDFIGMPRGRAVNFGKNQFWPKGERVKISLVPLVDGKRGKAVALSTLIRESKQDGKESGVGDFVFVGTMKEGPNEVILVDDTGTIASLFSDPFTVLDVPTQTPQGEHYGSVTAAGNKALDRDGHLLVVIEPEYPSTKRRVKDLSLTVIPGDIDGDLAFQLHELNAPKTDEKLELPTILATFQKLIKDGHDPYLHLSFDPKISLKVASEFSRMIDTVSARGLIRIEATKGTPYYQALIPDPRWRDRKSRPAQPLELHITEMGESWKGKIVRPKFKRTTDGWDVDLTEANFDSKAALDKLVADDENGDALFYYLPDTIGYGELLSLYTKFYERWPVQYVLLNATE